MNARLGISLALLALAVVSAGALAAWGMGRVPGDDASYRVEALGPEGLLFDATVDVADATALTALQVAAAARGHDVVLVDYPGMGAYVRSIGGFEASGANGWVYEVLRDGAWVNGDRSAERFPLQNGDALRWSWTA